MARHHRNTHITKAFRLIVVRHGHQGELFEADVPRYRNREHEDVATTRDWYGQRGDASETRIKGLKHGMDLEYLRCGHFQPNTVFFHICVLDYTLFKGFVRCALDRQAHRCQVQAIRWR